MLTKTHGLVVRVIKYGESSLIFDLYTRELGLSSYIVGGVRKAKSRTPASLFQLMNWIEVVAYVKDADKLHRVKEVRPLYHYQSVPFDIQKRSIALFMTEIVQKTIKERETNEALYSFLFDTFTYLDHTDDRVHNTHLVFLIELSQYLGFTPHGSWQADRPYLDMLKGTYVPTSHPMYTLSADQSAEISLCSAESISTAHRLRLTREQRQRIIRNLLSFYRLHIERLSEIHTHQILADVLAD